MPVSFGRQLMMPMVLMLMGLWRMELALGEIVSKEGCGKTKGCHFEPSGCDPTASGCTMGITYKKNGDVVEFELFSKLPTPINGPKYVAVGFSRDNQMGDDAVTYCVYSPNNDKIIVSLAYNPSKFNQLITDRTLIDGHLSDVNGSVVNGILQCRFSQKVQPANVSGASQKIFPLDKEYYLLIATSGATMDANGTVAKLDEHIIDRTNNLYPQVMVSNPVAFDSYASAVQAASPNSSAAPAAKAAYPKWRIQLAQSHAILMLFGWWLLVASAILFARYFKTMLNNGTLCSIGYWFHLHRTLNAIGVLAIATAFVCMFVVKDGVWTGNVYGYGHSRTNHAILGMSAAIGGFVQPIMAVFRCDKHAPMRPIFNWLHRFVGLAAWGCASAAIWFSTDFMPPLRVEDSYGITPRALIIFYWASLGLVVIGLEIWITLAERMKSGSATVNDIQLSTFRGKHVETVTAPPKCGFVRWLLLLFFMLVAIAVTVALACFIAIP